MDSLTRAIVRKLQGDLPLVREPYKQIAEELGILEEELFGKIRELKEKKALRRISGVLYHRALGFKANAMVVWQVPEENIREAAEYMAAQPAVSHCYEREMQPKWPYNLYTMLHAQNFEACEAHIKDLAKVTGISQYQALYSTRELKKSSMKYFMENQQTT